MANKKKKNVYPVNYYIISKKVCSLVVSFIALDRWSKKRRGEALLQKETQCILMIDELFDVLW